MAIFTKKSKGNEVDDSSASFESLNGDKKSKNDSAVEPAQYEDEEGPASSEAPTDPEVETEILDSEPKSILLGLISQLRKGMDLHRVALPTFVLEPRSMTERITDFMSHPSLILHASELEDPVERFIAVVRYFISGWHVKPKGVKKPYNPVLGEIHRCRWTYEDSSEAFYVCEQVSHHPPVSAYHYESPEHNLVIFGDIRPKSRFLGNSVATLMQGTNKIVFLKVGKEAKEFSKLFRSGKAPEDDSQTQLQRSDSLQSVDSNSGKSIAQSVGGEEYVLTLPNVYGRGILFGTMYMELGDTAQIQCAANGLTCDLKFETKGFFSGVYNGISGKIKRNGELLHTVSGRWSDQVYIQKGKSGPKDLLYDALGLHVHPYYIMQSPGKPFTPRPALEPTQATCVQPAMPNNYNVEDLEPNESRRIWAKVTEYLTFPNRNIDLATVEKQKVEDAQRDAARVRSESDTTFEPRFFELHEGEGLPSSDLSGLYVLKNTGTQRLENGRKTGAFRVDKFIYS